MVRKSGHFDRQHRTSAELRKTHAATVFDLVFSERGVPMNDHPDVCLETAIIRRIVKWPAIITTVISAATILMSTNDVTLAQGACTQMQVYLAIAPNHREDVMSYIAPKLKQKFNVDLVTEAIGSVMMVDRVTAQGASPRVSIVQWDVPIGIAACDKGQCAAIDVEKAPNLKKLPSWALSKGPSGKPETLTAGVVGVGILYNEDELKKHNLPVPRSWADLKKPDYAGRLGITAPESSMGTAALVMLAKINGGGEKNIDPGFTATKAITPKNTIFTWSSEMSNLFQLGDLWVAVNSNNLAPALRAKGLPIKFSLPTEGSPTANTGMSLVKNAPCQEAAYEYINLYFSDEFQAKRMASGTLSASKSAWAKISPDLQKELGMTATDLDKFIDLDWREINSARPGWIERWHREIK
jgi:putative spermidine/putrescine transport system substrate-binding protein